jgi:predicted GNAT superfamily acetyltransferase
MPDLNFTIRPLATLEEYIAHEQAQIAIWDIYDKTAVVSIPVLVTTQKNGGLVAAAWDTDTGQMIGVVYGFLGMTRTGKLKHCSHLMGVLPELRRTKVGEAIKRFQRDYVLKQGIDLITWTYDPLEGVNGNLNIGKLRCICRTYHTNLYGEMTDKLNTGIPTDRFEVEWLLTADRVVNPTPEHRTPEQLQAVGALLINPAIHGRAPVPLPGSICPLEPGALPDTLLVEVPAAYQQVKVHSMDAAREWRYHTRSIFQSLFALGYSVTDFLSIADTERRNYYVLDLLEKELSLSHD